MRTFTAATLLAIVLTPGAIFAQTADSLVVTSQPASIRANEAFAITVEAQDSTSGDAIDTSYSEGVTLVIASGPGILGGTTTVTAASGVATFSNLTLDAIGSVVLEAGDGTLPAGTAASIEVSADRLVITSDASNTTAGAVISGPGGMSVEAQDGYGTTDTNFTGGVSIAIDSGTGNLNGTTTVTAAAGQAVFDDLSINESGTYTLVFTALDLAPATSVGFDVAPDSPDRLAFVQQPSSSVAGSIISPAITVEVRDQFGNPVTSATNTVTLGISDNPGGATIGGTLSRDATSGVATFDDIELDEAGSGYTLSASAGGLTGDTSDAFDVSAAPSPNITVTAAMSDFTTTGVGTPSAEQSYTVEGEDLNDDITVTPPAHFEISLSSGSGFGASPVVLPQTGGNVAPATIYVRYMPANSGPHSDSITHTSSGAVQRDVAVDGVIAAAAEASLSAGTGNPAGQTAVPGSTRTGLVFRITETAGGTDCEVTEVVVDVFTTNNAGGVAFSGLATVALRRGDTTLDAVDNGAGGWSVSGDVLTVSLSGFSSTVSAGSNGDFSVALTFSGGEVPSPAPGYVCEVAPSGVNGGTSITGSSVSGGMITLGESGSGDLFEEVDDQGSCDLSTRGGPAWPMLWVFATVAMLALRRRRMLRSRDEEGSRQCNRADYLVDSA